MFKLRKKRDLEANNKLYGWNVSKSGVFFTLCLIVFMGLLTGCLSNRDIDEITKGAKDVREKADVAKSADKNRQKSPNSEEKVGPIQEVAKKEEQAPKPTPPKKKVQPATAANASPAPRSTASSTEGKEDFSNWNVGDKIWWVKKLLPAGKYDEVLRVTDGETHVRLKYYRAITYYIMMLSVERYTEAETKDFMQKALSGFEELMRSAGGITEERSMLWYYTILGNQSSKISEKKEAIAGLKSLIKKYPNSIVANDSQLYISDFYVSLYDFETARQEIEKISSPKFADNVVYDRDRKRIFPVETAAEYVKAKLEKIEKNLKGRL